MVFISNNALDPNLNACISVTRPTDYVIWINYYLLMFQPMSGITTVLDSVAYCYVTVI